MELLRTSTHKSSQFSEENAIALKTVNWTVKTDKTFKRKVKTVKLVVKISLHFHSNINKILEVYKQSLPPQGKNY
jgi:hypothetical protein